MSIMYKDIEISERSSFSVDDKGNQVLQNLTYKVNFKPGDILARFILHNDTVLRITYFEVLDVYPGYFSLVDDLGQVYKYQDYSQLLSGTLDPGGGLKLSYYWRLYE